MSGWWRPRSMRMRLTLWYAGTLTVALVAYALLVYGFLWRVLWGDLDHRIQQDINVAERMLEEKDNVLSWDEDDFGSPAEMPRVEVLSQEGKVLFRSSTYLGVSEPDYRIARRTGRLEGLPPVVIAAARSTAATRRELAHFALVLALGIPLAVALAGAGGYALARRALAPVDRMAAQARAITADRLSERLSVENPDDELGRLALAFNDAFSRLERSFEELRRFTADASHELRTPLTAIRSIGEVGLDERRGERQYREIIGSMLEESDRLTRLVDSLLTLSRADGGQMRLRPEPTDLSALAASVVQHLGVLAEEKRQSIELVAGDPVSAAVDPLVLRQALANLLDNAIKYSPDDSLIRVEVRQEPGRAIVEVLDQGPGIPPAHRERIFDRFYRVERGRSRSMGGVGLGLAIARWAVEAHGGVIQLDHQMERGSRFRIVIPNSKEV